ncbi:uncharacterized protein OCT59_020892 [Rhizophagus irregularis]|uniref:uncharacterized protein n=1 Tax=Rhizophagus irregularis TaxID=588596 RepID=UPI001A03D735|nr:hypothetical protein OCT59_020892 [Rhizophagus irregularis]GBC26765.2 kinase-like domain-containing protein [Rhizophagus irregularis DAOM 181602=DAOM 197198]
MFIKCNECKRKRKTLDESHQICHICHKSKILFKSSGNKIIDDFIRFTQVNLAREEGKMEFVTYDQFKNIEFIAEGGYSKVYKATWVDGPIDWYNIKRENSNITHRTCVKNYKVILKNLNNSKNITLKELNELKVFYQILSNINNSVYYISTYLGITQDPITKIIIIIMPYYSSGDLTHYLSNDFYIKDWKTKLSRLLGKMAKGLSTMHATKLSIKIYIYSGNILVEINDYGNSNTYIAR